MSPRCQISHSDGRARASGRTSKSRSAAASNVSAIALGSAGRPGCGPVPTARATIRVDAQVAAERVFSDGDDPDDEHQQRGHRRQRLQRDASVVAFAQQPRAADQQQAEARCSPSSAAPPGAITVNTPVPASASSSPAAPIAAPAKQSQRPARAARDSGPRDARVSAGIGRAPDELAS